MTGLIRFRVRYQFGTYSGERYVWADCSDEAVYAVKRMLKPYMTLPMAYESFHAEEA